MLLLPLTLQRNDSNDVREVIQDSSHADVVLPDDNGLENFYCQHDRAWRNLKTILYYKYYVERQILRRLRTECECVMRVDLREP